MQSSDTGDVADGETASQDLVFAEGMLVDDDGTLIRTFAVHLRQAPDLQWPNEMPVVIKASEQRFAMEQCRAMRLSKPVVFRKQGETLISDVSEGITRREESSESVRVNDPADLSRAAEFDDEMNRGAAALGSTRRTAVTSTKTTSRNSSKTTHTYGKNGWIWCAAIEPGNEREWQAWLRSLDEGYDCVTTIESPRAFAHQLAMAAARQLGPRGSTGTYTHPFTKHQTEHPTMNVFHGPVAYVDDPHAYVSGAESDFERMVRAVFFKHMKYADQREYRFVVWTAEEPEQEIVDLDATPELLSLVRTTPIGMRVDSVNVLAGQPTGSSCMVAQIQDADQAQTASNEATVVREVGGSVEASEMESVPTPPIHVVVSANTMQQSALTARFAAVIESLRTASLREGVAAEFCAAAFHLEWIVMKLLLTFVDPIESFDWTDGVLVATLSTPVGSGATAQISVGPLGTAQYRITTDGGHEDVSCKDGFMIADAFIDDLLGLGLPTCAQALAEGCVPPPPSIPQQGTERVDRRSTGSTQIQRMSVRNAQNLSEAEIDAANAAEESGPTDARITKLVVDGGPGAISMMHGVRAGLSGTYRQRRRHDRLIVRVETMNPDATVQIDPPDSAPDQDGHVVAVPDGHDTVITITATSPDGTAQSEIKYIAQRTAQAEPEAA